MSEIVETARACRSHGKDLVVFATASAKGASHTDSIPCSISVRFYTPGSWNIHSAGPGRAATGRAGGTWTSEISMEFFTRIGRSFEGVGRIA